MRFEQTRRARVMVLTAVMLAASVAVRGDAPAGKPFFTKQILLGAHRGGANVVPENTLAGFKEAAKRWPGILLEADAALTADGQVVLLHDGTVDRTTNGAGKITDMTLAAVKQLDAGYKLTLDGGQTYPYRGTGATIATLKEVLQGLPDSHFLVEFKPSPNIVEATLRVIKEEGAEDRVLLASFKPEDMKRAREFAPKMAMCFDRENGMVMLNALRNGGWDDYEPAADVLSLMRRMVKELSLTPEEIQTIREKGIRFQIHTVDDPDEMRHWLDVGVDSILTDRPDLLADVVSAWKAKS
jgi:glycerophosphoryl diester phosphodiesterase